MTIPRLIPIALAVLVASGAAVASAGVADSVPTKLKMRNGPPAFHGKVKSLFPECESERRVKLFRERPGGARQLLGRTDSKRNGKWYIPVDPLLPGGYVAKAKQHIVSIDGVVVLCEPDYAPGIVVD